MYPVKIKMESVCFDKIDIPKSTVAYITEYKDKNHIIWTDDGLAWYAQRWPLDSKNVLSKDNSTLICYTASLQEVFKWFLEQH